MKKMCMVLLFAATLTMSAFSAKRKESIGFSQCILDSPFYVALMDAAKEAAVSHNIDFIYLDAQNNIQKQNNDILDLINRGVSALIINPVDPDGVKPALERARRAGIPVITVDRPVNDKVDCFIGRDNRTMGKLAGELAVNLLGGKGKAKGNILELQGDAGGSVMMARRDGFHTAVDKENITVIQSPYCNYIRANAVKAAQDIIQAHPDIDLIYAHNDDMALGAIAALKGANRLNGCLVSGVDATDAGLKAVQAGELSQTIKQDAKGQGEGAITLVQGFLSGHPPTQGLVIPFTSITRSNIAQFAK